MDFVQRNLINERNNLQVELAKAKLLIAELSEATNYNNSPNKDVKSKLSEFEQGRKANTAKPVGDKITKNSSNKPKPMSEEAEYISDLENVIIAIAEQLGVHPNDLLNELNVGGAIKSGFKDGGVMGAIKGGANAVGHNVKQTLRGGSVVPTAANRADSTAKQVGADYDRAKTAAKTGQHVKIAGKALQGVRKITNNRGMDDAVSPALDSIRNSGY